MHSLPDLERLNRRAVEEHRKRNGRAPSPRGKTCACCEKENTRYMIPWHDPFGDAETRKIPKGYLPICGPCYESGRWQDGYFTCDGCGEVHVDHYSYEAFFRDFNDGRFCLECALHRSLDSDDPSENPWVYQEDVDRLKKFLEAGKAYEVMSWVGLKAKHLIAAKTEFFENRLIFQGNVELDSGTGKRIAGIMGTDPTHEGAAREMIGHLENVLANTQMRDFLVAMGDKEKMPRPRCALIIDSIYQFCVSIGIYFERKYTGAAAKGLS